MNESDPKRNVVPVERPAPIPVEPTAAMYAREESRKRFLEASGQAAESARRAREAAGIVGSTALSEVSIEPNAADSEPVDVVASPEDLVERLGPKPDVSEVPEGVAAPNEFDDLVNGIAPSYEFQEGNDLSEQERQQIRESVAKNEQLVQTYGPANFNQPRE